MNFGFIPFKLWDNIASFKDLEFIGTDNGVSYYKADSQHQQIFDSINIISNNLYFFESKLITVYINLENSLSNFELSAGKLNELLGTGKFYKSRFTCKYIWRMDAKILILLKDQINNKLYIYYTLQEYCIY